MKKEELTTMRVSFKVKKQINKLKYKYGCPSQNHVLENMLIIMKKFDPEWKELRQ